MGPLLALQTWGSRRGAPPALHAEIVLSAQRLAGNRAVADVLGPPGPRGRPAAHARPTVVQRLVGGPAATRPVLRRGVHSADVTDVQQRLNNLMGASLAEDGRFGPATYGAVRAFQQARVLPADGVVGPRTWAALVGTTAPVAAPAPAGATSAVPANAGGTTSTTGRTPAGAGAGRPVAGEEEVARRALAAADAGGLTVALYVSPVTAGGEQVSGQFEHRGQATQYSQDHGGFGLRDGVPQQGVAMEMDDGVPARLAALQTRLNELLLRHPDITQNRTVQIPVKNLAIFTHGSERALQAGPRGAWISRSVNAWVSAIAPFLTASPRILLYACSTAGRSRGIPFAELLQQSLQSELERLHGPGRAGPEVWGHTNVGHTTANRFLVGFGGDAGGNLIDGLGARFAQLAAERSGRTLSERQAASLATTARSAMARVMKGRTGKTDPLNVYIREVPQLGIDRVWQQLSTPQTVDVSDLGMTPEATRRLLAGVDELRGRFERELARLVQSLGRTRAGAAAP